MRFSFSEREQEIRLLGRRLAESLHRFELPIDKANDAVPPVLEREIRDVCLAASLFAPHFCVWSVLWRPTNVLIQATNAQRERDLLPHIRREFRGAHAITEPNAGSDVNRLETVVVPVAGDNRQTGEKWFVTGGRWCRHPSPYASRTARRSAVAQPSRLRRRRCSHATPATVSAVNRAAMRALRPAVSPMIDTPSQVSSRNSAKSIVAAMLRLRPCGFGPLAILRSDLGGCFERLELLRDQEQCVGDLRDRGDEAGLLLRTLP